MNLFVLLLLLAATLQFFNSRAQQQRMTLLGSYLRNYQIEKLMEQLTQGYLRALDESDPERRAQIWGLMEGNEATLAEQFQRFVADFSREDEVRTRVSRLPIALPLAERLFPSATLDLRKLLAVHAHGIRAAVANERQLSVRDKAYTLSAELFLMQHSCHWFCRSRAVASTRLLARHKTSYEQVLAAVAPQTRDAYRAVTGR